MGQESDRTSLRLKRARQYLLCSRTIVPIFSLYVAGFAVGRVLYFATGHLGLVSGPLGELRRPIPGATGRFFPAGGWMDWVPVVLAGLFLVAEANRQQGRRVSWRERLLVAGYAVAAVGGAGVTLVREVPEPVLAIMALLAGGLFLRARWSRWTGRLRVVAVATGLVGAGVAMALLRFQDVVRLRYPSG